jgi:hypothetical protein
MREGKNEKEKKKGRKYNFYNIYASVAPGFHFISNISRLFEKHENTRR